MSRISNRRMKEIRSLTQTKYRNRYGEALVEGFRAVEAALDAGTDIREILVTDAARGDARLRDRLDALGNRVCIVSEEDVDAVSTVESSQGIVAVAAIERLSLSDLSSYGRLLVLDGLSDPGNAGTLIRTAAWFGVEGVVTASGTVDLYNPKVVRSAMGGLWDIGHAGVEDAASALRVLRDAGFAVYGADMEGTSVHAWRPVAPSVLVLGNEAHGLSDAVRSEIQERVVIPGQSRRGGTESLNVAVAAGILMYEWTRPL